jgi:hypothetical protein
MIRLDDGERIGSKGLRVTENHGRVLMYTDKKDQQLQIACVWCCVTDKRFCTKSLFIQKAA